MAGATSGRSPEQYVRKGELGKVWKIDYSITYHADKVLTCQGQEQHLGTGGKPRQACSKTAELNELKTHLQQWHQGPLLLKRGVCWQHFLLMPE